MNDAQLICYWKDLCNLQRMVNGYAFWFADSSVIEFYDQQKTLRKTIWVIMAKGMVA